MSKATSEIPNKLFYKIGEVCDITDTQPYVLRFWESEFPQLSPKKNRSGQRVYRRKDIDTVMRIKQLLYEEEYTIAGARKKLDDDLQHGSVETPAKPASGRAGTGRRSSSGEDHLVDALTARTSLATTSTRPNGTAAAGDREARLYRALVGLKLELQEILQILREE